MYVNEVCFMENKIEENRKHVLLWLYNLNNFLLFSHFSLFALAGFVYSFGNIFKLKSYF